MEKASVPPETAEALSVAARFRAQGWIFKQRGRGEDRARKYDARLLLQGSGPFGIPLPQDVRRLTRRVEGSLGQSWPQLRDLLNTPGGIEARQVLMKGLMQRAGARFVKLLFGPTQPKQARQQQLPDASSPQPLLTQTSVLPPAAKVQAEVLPPLETRGINRTLASSI